MFYSRPSVQLDRAPGVTSARTLLPLIRRRTDASASILRDFRGIISPHNSVKVGVGEADRCDFQAPLSQTKRVVQK